MCSGGGEGSEGMLCVKLAECQWVSALHPNHKKKKILVLASDNGIHTSVQLRATPSLFKCLKKQPGIAQSGNFALSLVPLWHAPTTRSMTSVHIQFGRQMQLLGLPSPMYWEFAQSDSNFYISCFPKLQPTFPSRFIHMCRYFISSQSFFAWRSSEVYYIHIHAGTANRRWQHLLWIAAKLSR